MEIQEISECERTRNFYTNHNKIETEENTMCNMPTINMTKTGQNIISLRKRAGLSVKDLQEIFGFATPQAIYKWQQGVALPAIDNLVVLAALFEVSIADILVMDEVALMRIGA